MAGCICIYRFGGRVWQKGMAWPPIVRDGGCRLRRLPSVICSVQTLSAVCVPAAEFVRESAAAGNTQTVNSMNVRCRVRHVKTFYFCLERA